MAVAAATVEASEQRHDCGRIASILFSPKMLIHPHFIVSGKDKIGGSLQGGAS